MGKITKIEGTGVYEGYVTWQGWDPHEDFLGPFYHKRVGDEIRCAFLAEEKHVNGGGGLHGGLLLSFADHSIFVIAQDCLGEDAGGVTVSLHGEFCAGGQKGDFVEAQKQYKAVIESATDTKESRRQKRFAQIGAARCAAETQSADAGIESIEKIIAENDSSDAELFASAYNALGDCLQKKGQSKDALMAYLHVDILFYADSEKHAESLYHLTNLWSQLKNTDRAAAARNLLTERYSGTIWASKLQ